MACEMQPGDLTTCGMLYEGSELDSWRKRIRCVHRAQRKFESPELDVRTLKLTAKRAQELIRCDKAVNTALRTRQRRYDPQLAERDVAMARIGILRKYVQEEPGKPVREVWNHAQQICRHPLSATGRLTADHSPIRQKQRNASVPLKIRLTGPPTRAATVDLMCKNISPTILSRMPNPAKASFKTLCEFLPALLKPFPLLELSKEVRVRIYGFVFDKVTPIVEPLPPILPVNKQIREEASTLFYSRTISSHGIRPLTEDPKVPQRTFDRIVHWSRCIARDHIRKLRHFLLHTISRNSSGEQILILSVRILPDVGLFFHFSTDEDQGVPTGQAIDIVEKHFLHIEEMRKTLRLQGESIIMALVSCPDLWEPGRLCVKY